MMGFVILLVQRDKPTNVQEVDSFIFIDVCLSKVAAYGEGHDKRRDVLKAHDAKYLIAITQQYFGEFRSSYE